MTKIFTCIALGLFSISSFAQKRAIEMELIYDAPAPLDTLPSGIAVPMVGSIKNNGPDNLIAGDTIVFTRYTSTGPGGNNTPIDVKTVRLKKGIAKGEQSVAFTDSISLYASQGIGFTYLCLEIMADPSTDNNGFSYIDPGVENNGVCLGIYVARKTTSISSIQQQSVQLNIVPNPATNKVSLTLPSASTHDKRVTVRDILGRTVMVVQQYARQNLVELDISTLANGLYIVEMQDGTIKAAGKLEVRH